MIAQDTLETYCDVGNRHYIVRITDEMRALAQQIANRRSDGKDTLPSSRFLAHGNSSHFLGCLGEIGFGLLVHKSFDIVKRMSGDKGTDFVLNGKAIDIKTSQWRGDDCYLKVEVDKAKRSDIYVLCQYFPDRLIYLGWAEQSEVLKAPIKTFGQHNIHDYCLVARLLHPMPQLLRCVWKVR